MSSNQTEDNYVSLVRVPRNWFNAFICFFSTVIVVNTLIELLTDWSWQGLGETPFTRMAVLMTLTVGWFFILSHIWEMIMLGYAKIFRDKVFAEGKAEGIAEGKAEGIAEGIAEGKAEGIAETYTKVYRELAAWQQRKEAAEARGEEFTEPLPIPKPQDTVNTKNS